MASVPVPIWKGTVAESVQWANAVQNNCDCADAKGRCAAHRGMLDQRVCDGVLFGRFLFHRQLNAEEWSVGLSRFSPRRTCS